MSRRNPNVSVNIDLEANASGARREIAKDLDRIEGDAKDAAREIERALESISPELDTSEIRRALDLAEQLDGMVASFTVDTDLAEIREAEQIARSLRSFQGRVDLSVEGRAELRDALGLAEKMDQIRTVKVQVQGREDLEKAARLADDLERRRTIPIDAQASDLVRLDDEITAAGERGADGISDAIGGIDFADIGGAAAEQMSGALAAAGPWAAAAGTIGALVGDEIAEGINNAIPNRRADTARALRNNLAGDDMADVGKAAGEVYSAGLGQGLAELKDTAALIKGELGDIDDELDLTEATRQAEALAEVFGVDILDAVTAVDSLVERGLVRNTQEGFNLLFDLGQRLGIQFEEMLDLVDEFGPAVEALGIQGAHGLEMIAEMVERRVTPQVDQAGELFEELNETILTGGAAEGLEQIGLNAEEMQRIIAGGGPQAAAAVADIARAILDLDDPAQRAAASTAIFGSNMGLLGDEARDTALEVFATADATDEVGTSASDAADALEDSAGAMEKMRRHAVDLGDTLAGPIAGGIETIDALQRGDWDAAIDGIRDYGATLTESILNPLQRVGVEIPVVSRLTDWIRGAGDAAAEAGPNVDMVGNEAAQAAREMEQLGPASSAAADGMDQVTSAAELLDAALQAFSGRFDQDQIMRRIEEDTLAAKAAVEGLTGKAYELGTGFDISTEKGRAAQAAFEDLSGSLDVAIASYETGAITGQQLADKHAAIEGAVREVAAAMGATQAETDELIGKYAAVPAEVKTVFRAETQAAIGAVAAYAGAVLAVPTSRTTTLTTYQQTIIRPTASANRFGLAAGGPVTPGQVYKVGERGEELFVSDEPGQILPHDETRRLLNNNPRAQATTGAGRPGGAGGGGVQRVEVVIGSDGSEFADMVVRAVRKGSRNRGGVDPVTGRR